MLERARDRQFMMPTNQLPMDRRTLLLQVEVRITERAVTIRAGNTQIPIAVEAGLRRRNRTEAAENDGAEEQIEETTFIP